MKLTAQTSEETKLIGKNMAPTLLGGVVLCLHGELGAGKTTFVKGLAEGLGVTQTIVSPTFTLMQLYPIPERATAKQLVHIDTYRLHSEHELLGIGAEDYVGMPSTISVIEWPEKIPELLHNKKVVNIFFDHLADGGRSITVVD